MIHHLQNSHLQVSIDPDASSWSLASSQAAVPAVENARMGISYRKGRKGFYLPGEAALHRAVSVYTDTPHGRLSVLTFESPADPNGIRGQFIFALPEQPAPDEQPFLLLKGVLENGGRQPVNVKRFDLLNAGFVLVPATTSSMRAYARTRTESVPPGQIRLASSAGEPAFFSNGWQSWNYTGVYGMQDRSRRTRLGPITSPMRGNPGTPQPKRQGLFGSDFFGVMGDRRYRTGVLCGFLSQQQHFGSLEALLDPLRPALRMWANGDDTRLDPGEKMETDWAWVSFLRLDEPDPLGAYMEAVARQNGVELLQNKQIPTTGWSSWYYFNEHITAAKMRENLEAVASLNPEITLDLFQIDDGFQSNIGDWFTFMPGFPQGVAPLVKEISSAGLTPGLWLAPFIVHPKSRLAQEHPDWLLLNRAGKPVNAGYMSKRDAFIRALDLTVPDALDYACQVIDTACHEWGYRFLKLDFLYAASVKGQYRDRTKTRAQVLRRGLEAVRAAAGPETFLLGCGCPLGPAVGLFESMRIGSDVDQRWHPAFMGIEFFFRPEPDFPSARNATHNAITRSAAHRRWWVNDPDCLILRPQSEGKGGPELTLAEIQTLATTIAITGGTLLISEHIPALPPERLDLAKKLLPLIGKAPRVLDWFDSATPGRLVLELSGPTGDWWLAALFNWADRKRDLLFRPDQFYLNGHSTFRARSFWDGVNFKDIRIDSNGLVLRQVPAHGVVLLAVRRQHSLEPQYLGGNLHISQGMEVVNWNWEPEGLAAPQAALGGRLHFRLERPGNARGEVDLALPRAPREAYLNGEKIIGLEVGEGIFRFPVAFQHTAEVRIDV